MGPKGPLCSVQDCRDVEKHLMAYIDGKTHIVRRVFSWADGETGESPWKHKEKTVNRGEKQNLVDALRADLADKDLLVVTQQNGLTVAETQALRRKMRESQAYYKVAKNTLLSLALKGTRHGGVVDYLKGPTAIAYSKDPISAAKAAVEFSKSNEKLHVVCGVMGDKFIDADGIKALASLPSLDELRGKIIGVIQAPATKVAGVLAAPAGQLARVVAAYAKK